MTRVLSPALLFALCLACAPPDSPGGGGGGGGDANPVCGDGRVEGSELCDDGNTDESDGCLNNCVENVCGDGAVYDGMEACDDGNQYDLDACTSDCETAVCGDGLQRIDLSPGQEGYEACDDANDLSTDACIDCVDASCGDAFVQDGVEDCDDGDSEDDNACTNACELAACGDGIVRQGLRAGETGFEACDDGNVSDDDGCLSDCVEAACGDGVQRQDLAAGAPGYEECDDGNDEDEDDCSNACVLPYCGDGWIATGESCDDGNDLDNDGCTNACNLAACGDGVIRVDRIEGQVDFEACDDGNDVAEDACIDCVIARCGDGVVRTDIEAGGEGYEACDDANEVDSDACLDCLAAACGDGVLREDLEPSDSDYEACDDGNDDAADDCNDCERTCVLHAECQQAADFEGTYCHVNYEEEIGTCMDIRRQRCEENLDCYARDRSRDTARLVCDEGACVRSEFSTCSEQRPCASGLECLGPGETRCKRPCEAHDDCPLHYTRCGTGQGNNPPEDGYCGYRFCGGADELPANFRAYAQGQLGGACENGREGQEDGYCLEVAVSGGSYIGICFDGGNGEEDDLCEHDVDRADDDAQCGGGLACIGFDARGAKHCRSTCVPEQLHGERDCPNGSTCTLVEIQSGIRGYGCLPEAEVCDVAALDSCGDDGYCLVLTADDRNSHCQLAAEERVDAHEACTDQNQCPDGYHCWDRRQCRRICVQEEDCADGWTCLKSEDQAIGGCAPEPEEPEEP